MNLYLLTQNENIDYDTYDSMVIAAENEEDARYLSFVEAYIFTKNKPINQPNCTPIWRDYYMYTSIHSGVDFTYADWAEHPSIRLIATNTTEPEGVVCSSFNAG